MPHREQPPPRLHRAVLGNGLRVLIQPLPGVPRVAVAVHYGVGHRSEPPGREGFAHLFEHLMFRGSERLPGGRFNDHVHRLGGRANGTTHQDYTDYYQATPVRALDEALFAEADRMRAPLFTEESLAEQLRGVAAEIRGTVSEPPYGGLPWPLLSGVLFDTYANAHDGYGDAEHLLRRTTVEDCADFFRTHYAPGNAVLTLVGGVDAGAAADAVARHFADIPARPFAAPSPSALAEPPLRADRWAHSARPGGVPRTALVLGTPLPDPVTARRAHLAYAVLARMIQRYGRTALGYPSVSASCGFFGPLDAWAPDPLVVLATLPDGTAPPAASRDLSALCARWADDPALPKLVSRAQGALAIEHARAHADIQTRARALGRLELLFGDAELLDALPGRTGGLEAAEIAEAAREFAAAPKAHVVRERTAPPAATPTRAPQARAGAGAVPTRARTPRPRRPAAPGPRILTVPDHRAGIVELALRAPLPAPTWYGLTRAPADGFTVTADGEGVTVTGCTVPGRVRESLDALAELLARPLPAVPARLPAQRLDAETRRRWPEALTGTGIGPRPVRPALCAVGAVDPDALEADAEATFAHWPGVTVTPTATAPAPPQDDAAHLALSTPEPHDGPSEAARYLATAAYAGFAASRLFRRFAPWNALDPGAAEVHAGRDLLYGTPRAYVRAKVAPDLADEALGLLRAEARRLVTEPFTDEELRPAREFCAAQLLSAHDSPAAHAAVLCQWSAAGRDPALLAGIDEALRAVPTEEAARAAAALFAAPETTVLINATPTPNPNPAPAPAPAPAPNTDPNTPHPSPERNPA